MPDYLPHSLEGESFRVDIYGTPVSASTENTKRSNKTVSKFGVSGLWIDVFKYVVEHIFPHDEAELNCDMKTRKII